MRHVFHLHVCGHTVANSSCSQEGCKKSSPRECNARGQRSKTQYRLFGPVVRCVCFLLSTKKVNANETSFNKSSCGYEQNEIPETLVLKGFQALSQPYLQVCSSVASTNANKDGKVHASLDFETLFCLFLCFSMCWSSLFFQKQRHFANILAEQPM